MQTRASARQDTIGGKNTNWNEARRRRKDNKYNKVQQIQAKCGDSSAIRARLERTNNELGLWKRLPLLLPLLLLPLLLRFVNGSLPTQLMMFEWQQRHKQRQQLLVTGIWHYQEQNFIKKKQRVKKMNRKKSMTNATAWTTQSGDTLIKKIKLAGISLRRNRNVPKNISGQSSECASATVCVCV